MLTLLFQRGQKRRMVGLLALGEWGPATGAITGSVATQQPGQESHVSGTVSEPAVIVVGGGVWRGRLLPQFTTKIPAITGSVTSEQARQVSLLTGEMIDTELEMFAATMLEIA